MLAVIFFLSSAFFLLLLWGVGWFSFLWLIVYLLISIYLVYYLDFLPFSCLLSDTGNIEINKPIQISGNISSRSFYNGWVIFLCIEITEPLLVSSKEKHNKPKKWFVVLYDSVTEKEYRLLARFINSKNSR